ncbi:MAG: hypothetical protein ACRELG_05715 [Gemmataceae bacterium]
MTTDFVVKILAVIGGGVVGGLGMGLLAQLLSRALTTKKLPPWTVLMVRVLSGVICGWFVYLGLFSGGGSGIGGPGGGQSGSGPGQSGGEKPIEVTKKNGDDRKNGGEAKTAAGETLRIEVLGSATLSESAIQAERWYRIDTDDGSRLLTFAEVKEAVKNRQQEQPPLRRIEMVLYKDSPDERVPLVSQLRTWASDLNGGKMKVDLSQPDADAPRK